jgi:hypothetical protein
MIDRYVQQHSPQLRCSTERSKSFELVSDEVNAKWNNIIPSE